ncbi:MAG: transcription antitermination factor NusB [Candidatus Gastranaerophilales bacterium]|nr:transcription antitermination factor NusB [Candidatus Gastranaerophilales bacterium]
MQARRASRELALILFSQLDKKITEYSEKDFDDIILKSIRVLSNNSTDELKTAVGSLIDIKDYIDTYEADDQSNLERPIGAKNKPVPIPTTLDMSDKITTILDIVEKTVFALEIAEFAVLESQNEVKSYVIEIARAFKEHHDKVDEQIQKFSKGWDINRLVKMDKDILRIAIIELLYTKGAPMKVIVDEALELAKKYSTEDSAAFVNGILAKVIIENGIG